jgi:hypothetical protein
MSNDAFVFHKINNTDISKEYLESLNNNYFLRFSDNRNMTHSIQSQQTYIDKNSNAYTYLLLVKKIDDNKNIGTVKLSLDFTRYEIDVGIMMFLGFSNKGDCSAILRQLTKFIQLNFPKFDITLGFKNDHLAMRKCAERAGFAFKDLNLNGADIQYSYPHQKYSSNIKAKIPLLLRNARKIGLVANDAGGGQQLYWLTKNIVQDFFVLAQGPALSIFTHQDSSRYRMVNSFTELEECDLVVTGTGWMTDFEVNAINFCKSRKILTLSVLDHWVNYQDRFKRSSIVLPSLLGVTNKHAFSLALEHFPEIPIFLLPDNQLRYYKKILKNSPQINEDLIILLEPDRYAGEKFTVTKKIVNSLLSKASTLLELHNCKRIKLRPHPSQLEAALFSFQEFLDETVVMSSNLELLDDLLSAKTVIGFNSYGLYLSSMCNIETKSVFKNFSDHWTFRFDQIGEIQIL